MLRFKKFLIKACPHRHLFLENQGFEGDYSDIFGGFEWGNRVMLMREFSQEERFIKKFREIPHEEAFSNFYLEVFVKRPLQARDTRSRELIPHDTELVYRGFLKKKVEDKEECSIISLGFGDEKRGSNYPGRHCKYFHTLSEGCSYYLKRKKS